jgi:pilus assembly protein CpaF
MIPLEEFQEALAELLSPVAQYLRAPDVGELLVNGPSHVFVERHGVLERVAARFESEAALRAALCVIAQYVGRPLDDEHPILEARLPDGSRVEAVLGALAHGGSHLAVRRFQAQALSLRALEQRGALSADMACCLERAVEDKRNVLVAGGTGTGKTSLLKVLGALIPASERIVVIEDARELMLVHPHAVSLEARPADARGRGAVSIRQLLRATLRLRPDRIVLGEIRDGAALDLLQAMTSGHGGCLATVHASHPRDALARLETLALYADSGLPLGAIRQQVASALDLVVQVERLRDGRRVVASITAVDELDAQGRYALRTLHSHAESPHWLAAEPERAGEPLTTRREPA